MQKIIAKFKGRNPPPILFIKGDEPYFRREIIRSIRGNLKARGYEVEALNGKTASPGTIVNSLDSVGMFGEQKLVIVTGAEKVKGAAKPLCNYIEEPSDGVVAIFDGKGEMNTPLGKCLAAKATTFESKPLSPYKGDVEKWMVNVAKDNGKGLATNMARAIHNAIGTDLNALHGALKKVMYHTDGSIIGMKDIRAVLLKTAGNQTYELTNALGARDLKRALYVLDGFYRSEDEPAIFLCSSLLKHVERLIRAKSLLEYGLEPGDAARVIGMHPFLFKTKLQPQLKSYTLTELIDMMDHLCAVDLTLKGSGLDRRTQLEHFLVRFLD